MKKEQYDKPVMEILCFDREAVIRTSNTTEIFPIDIEGEGF